MREFVAPLDRFSDPVQSKLSMQLHLAPPLPTGAVMPWPDRIDPDPIVEVLLEIQFAAPLSDSAPELLPGRLADNPAWHMANHHRLPPAEIPHQLRLSDPGLRHQPLTQLQIGDRARIVKVGSHVLSYHALAPYPGWTHFKGELSETVDHLFRKVTKLRTTRLGLRYINVLTSDKHKIGGITDLNFRIEKNGQRLLIPQNLNYLQQIDAERHLVVRIASKEFVASAVPPSFAALIDVDVSTPEGVSYTAPSQAIDWLEKAHATEKDAFFELLPEELIEELGQC